MKFFDQMFIVEYFLDDNKTNANEIGLLCSDGGVASLEQYEHCNLGKIPPKFVCILLYYLTFVEQCLEEANCAVYFV